MINKPRILLEVPVESLAEAQIAVRGGANRLELCAALNLDGLTPPLEMLDQFACASPAPFVVMIRPRAGDFMYNSEEARVMAASIKTAIAHGAAGVVFGALTRKRTVDVALSEKLIAAAGHVDTVFHRAFDQVIDSFATLDKLIDLGFTRILTSGGGACAADPELSQRIGILVERANGRIELLPGGGIRPDNVSSLIAATNPAAVHSSCRRGAGSASKLDFELIAQLRRNIDSC